MAKSRIFAFAKSWPAYVTTTFAIGVFESLFFMGQKAKLGSIEKRMGAFKTRIRSTGQLCCRGAYNSRSRWGSADVRSLDLKSGHGESSRIRFEMGSVLHNNFTTSDSDIERSKFSTPPKAFHYCQLRNKTDIKNKDEIKNLPKSIQTRLHETKTYPKYKTKT